MKQIWLALLCSLFVITSSYAQEKKNKKETVTFFVKEMDCGSCIKKIEKNIAFEKGVTDLKCDLSKRTATVTYNSDKTSKTKLSTAFKKIGMEVTPVDNSAGCPVAPTEGQGHKH